MENANAANQVQVWGDMLHTQSQVSEPASGTGNLLDMRQDNHAPFCPSTEAHHSIAKFAAKNATAANHERLARHLATLNTETKETE